MGDDPGFTPDEPWSITLKPGHQYEAAAAYVHQTLGRGYGRSVLVIGSPPREAYMLADDGWQVTYLDWRRPPIMPGIEVRVGNALSLPFERGRFSALTSTCVLCHAGMGRYGDPVDEDGPSRMLAECRRVIRGDEVAVLMAGPVYAGPPISIGTIHRVTSLEEFDEHASSRGWAIEELAVWNPNTQAMLGPSEQISQNRDAPDYLCAVLRAV